MDEKSKLICDKCNVPMEKIDAQFRYIGKSFRHKVFRCPVCGQVYLSEDLVTGRMAEVERKLEDK